MNQHPFSVGQKVLCVFGDFSAAVWAVFDSLPQKNCAYTVSEVYWDEDNAMGQTVASVKLLEIKIRPHRSGGFPAWQFRLLEEGAESNAPPVAGGTPDESAAAAISQAADPTTEPVLLALLSRDGPPSLGWMLAANPNTPDFVLHKLWKTHPLAVLENPILAYQTLSTGRSLCKMLPLDVKLALYAALRNDGRMEEMEIHLPLKERCDWGGRCGGYRLECDPKILAAVAPLLVTDTAPAVRESMAIHLALTNLGPLAKDPVTGIRVTVANRVSSRVKGGVALMDILAGDPEEAVRLSLAACSSLNSATHERLASDLSQAVREKLARQKQDGPDIGELGWRRLVAGGSGLCLAVAQNDSCPDPVRLHLTAHKELPIRCAAWREFKFWRSDKIDQLAPRLAKALDNPELEEEQMAIAENSSLTEPIITRLLQCSEKVTRKLAANKRISMETRLLLLDHHDDETVALALEKIHGDDTVCMNLAFSHPSARVRAVLARRPGRRAANLRKKLAMDPAYPVRFSVCLYLREAIPYFDGRGIREALATLAKDPVARIRARVVQDRRLPQESLPALFEDKSVRVRLQVLKHRCGGSSLDLRLLDHKRVKVRAEAAELIMRNQRVQRQQGRRKKSEPRLPLLDARIARDPSPVVRVVAAKSSNTSLPVLKFLIDDEAPEVQRTLTGRNIERVACPAYEMNLLETSRNPYERATAAGIYGVGKKRLHRLAADRCWYVRAMTAKWGHKLDTSLLETLAADRHPMVQECARPRLNQRLAELARPAEGGRP
jgi:hypothetical protein